MFSPEIFINKIKPLCDKFVKSATKENIKELKDAIKDLDNSNLDIFQNYILLPLIMKLGDIKDERNSEIKTLLINCISDIISKSRIKQLEAFKTILVVVLKQIHDFGKGCLLPNLSEELKLASIECISLLLDRAIQEVLEEFYAPGHAFLIAKVGITCVEIISKEKYRLLRISAIKCLMALFYVHDDSYLDDIVMRNRVANVTFIFLPKTVQTLVEVSLGDNKIGESLISISITALGRILCLIFEDYDKNNEELHYNYKDFLNLIESSKKTNENIEDNNILLNSIKTNENIDERIKMIQNKTRNAEWLKASSKKLTKILHKTFRICANESVAIRMEYAKMCCNLAEKCFRYLRENFSTNLEAIIALTQDENKEISEMCNNCILRLRKNQNSEIIYRENISNLFTIHLNQLPQIINRCDDMEQTTEFLFLKGFFHILSEENIRTIFSFHENVNKFCMCLISALDLDLHKDLLTEEYALRLINNNDSFSHLKWRKFKKLNDKNLQLIKDICNILGRSIVVDLFADELLNILPRNTHICNEITLTLIFLLCDNDLKENDKRINFIKSILDEILQEKHWHLALNVLTPQSRNDESTFWYADLTPGLYESGVEIRYSNLISDDHDKEDDDDDMITISDVKFNILHTCVILDAIAHCSLSLGRDFQHYVFKSLHQVLRNVGSSNFVIHLSGNFALNCIKKALNFDEIKDLLDYFSGYISYHINMLLKKPHRSKEALDILNVLLQYSSIKSLTYLEKIISTILEESAKYTQNENVISYLKVFNTFLTILNEWNRETIDKLEKINISEQTEKDKYLEWMQILNKSKENDIDMDFKDMQTTEDEKNKMNDNTDNDENMKELLKEELPKYIQITVEIIQKTLKFLSSQNQALKILSMQCLITGLPILQNYENELLPIAHSIWYPLSQRFKDKDPIVLNQCFSLFSVLATYTKEFLLSRSLKDVFSFLCDFLKNSNQNSIRDINLTSTQEFKLQQRLLEELPNLIICMEIYEKELDSIMEAILPYLNRKQPMKLQQLALNCFKEISYYNKPLVYVKLIHNCNIKEFNENIERLLEYLRV